MTGKTKPQKVTIDLDEIWEPAGMGVLRGSAFAGLGTNAARDPNLTDFDLLGLLKLSYSRSTPNISFPAGAALFSNRRRQQRPRDCRRP